MQSINILNNIRWLTRVSCALALILMTVQPAHATWSIIAVDPRTGEVGSVGASCNPSVVGIANIVPGQGVLVVQAKPNGGAKRLGLEMLSNGANPEEIIAALADPSFDTGFQETQYGVVALGFDQAATAFTGDETSGWHGDVQGDQVSVQGNFLAGPEVVNNALAAFQADAEAPLADRLMAALEAGSAAGGDRRCGEQTALSAFLMVAQPTDDPNSAGFGIVIPSQEAGGANPVTLLREQYEQSKAERQPVRLLTLNSDEVLIFSLVGPSLVGLILALVLPFSRRRWRSGLSLSALIPPLLFGMGVFVLTSLNYIIPLWREVYLGVPLVNIVIGMLGYSVFRLIAWTLRRKDRAS